MYTQTQTDTGNPTLSFGGFISKGVFKKTVLHSIVCVCSQSFREVVTSAAALSYITYAGCGLSILTLLVAILTILSVR